MEPNNRRDKWLPELKNNENSENLVSNKKTLPPPENLVEQIKEKLKKAEKEV